MGKKERARKFSCLHCGTPFEAYPPDDRHTRATRSKKDYEDHIKIDYKCKDCGKFNTIYWGRIKPVFMAVG